MAYASLVTNGKGTTVRKVKFKEGSTTDEVDQVAVTLESLICEERDILHVETDYEGCDDSSTLG